MLPGIKTISWRDLTGNKYSKALHGAMLAKEGYRSLIRIRRIGEAGKDVFNVTYDKEYVIEFLSRKVCTPLSYVGKEKLLELISEAWDLYAKECLEPQAINRPID